MNIHTLVICASSVGLIPPPRLLSSPPRILVTRKCNSAGSLRVLKIRVEQETTLGRLMHFPCPHCVLVNS